MAHAVKIHLDDMHAFLTENGFSRIQMPDSTIELVYAKRVYQGDYQLSLRVYTSINPSGESRDCGDDAIRVALFLRQKDGTIVKLCGSKRVHRVVGWRKNLKDRLDNWLEYFPKETCKCGMPMVPRKGKYGNFIGCSNYPICKQKRNINEKV